MLPVKRRQHNAKLNGQNFYAPEFYSPASNPYDNNYYDFDDIDIVSQDQVSSVTFADAAALEMGDTVVEEKDDHMDDLRCDDERNGGFEHHLPVMEITAISTSARDRSRPLSPPSGSNNRNHRGRGGRRQRRSSLPSKFPSAGKQSVQAPVKEEDHRSRIHEPLSEKLLVMYNEEQQHALMNSQLDVNCPGSMNEEGYKQVIKIYKERIDRLVKNNQKMERRLKQIPREVETARQQAMDAIERLAEQQAQIEDLSQENSTLRRTVKDLLEHQGDNTRGSNERGAVLQDALELLKRKDPLIDVSLAPTAASTASKLPTGPSLRRCASFDSSTKFKASDTDSEIKRKNSSFSNSSVFWPPSKSMEAGQCSDSMMESTTEPPSVNRSSGTQQDYQMEDNKAVHDRIMEGLRNKKSSRVGNTGGGGGVAGVGVEDDDGGDTEEETSEEDKEQEALLLAHLNARDEINRHRGMGTSGTSNRLGNERATLRRARRRASASGALDTSKSQASSNSQHRASVTNTPAAKNSTRGKSQRPRRGSIVLVDGQKPTDAANNNNGNGNGNGKKDKYAPDRARKSNKSGASNAAAVNTKMKMTASQITSSRGRATSRRSLLLRRRQTPPPQRTGMNSAGIPVAITMQ